MNITQTGNTQSSCSCVGTTSSLLECMGYLEQVVCEKLGPKKAYQYFTFVILGCYPCLYCLVFHENMVKPLSASRHAPPRTYESICTDHQRYIASGVRRKQVKHFYNCITEHIFNIPIEQVNMHFVKYFCITTYTTYLCTYTPKFSSPGFTSHWASLQSFLVCLKMSVMPSTLN